MVATIEALSRRSPPLDLVIGLDVPEPRWLNRASRESAIEVKRSGEACWGRQWRPSLVVQLHSCSHACLRAYSCELHFVVITVPHDCCVRFCPVQSSSIWWVDRWVENRKAVQNTTSTGRTWMLVADPARFELTTSAFGGQCPDRPGVCLSLLVAKKSRKLALASS